MSEHYEKVPDKILSRIRSLLTMGGDPSSPNEASIALKRARKLMDEYQVELSDLNDLDDNAFGKGCVDPCSSRQVLWISTLAIAVANMNDCIAKGAVEYNQRRKKNEYYYEFFGYKEDVEVSKFMLSYLVDTCIRLYERDKKKLGLSGLRDKNDYLRALSNSLRHRINLLSSERKAEFALGKSKNALMLKKADTVKAHFGEPAYSQARTREEVNELAVIAGQRAAKEVHLGAFVTTDLADPSLIELEDEDELPESQDDEQTDEVCE